MRAQLFPQALMCALAQQVQVIVGEQRGKGVGIVDLPGAAVVLQAQAIALLEVADAEIRLKKVGLINLLRLGEDLALLVDDFELRRLRVKAAHDDRVLAFDLFDFGTEHIKGLAVGGVNDGAHRVLIERHG